MTEQISFTKRTIDTLPDAPPGKRASYADRNVPGLRLVVTDKGSKSWQVQKRIKGRGGRRLTLGRYPDMPPAAAKKKAAIVAAQIAEGVDPHAEKQKADSQRFTLGDALELYIERHNLKATTVKGYRQNIEVGLKDWTKKPLVEINGRMAVDRHAKLAADSGSPYADQVMRTLRALWNFAEGLFEDDDGNSTLPVNPAKRLSKVRAWRKPAPRKTYIKAHDLPAWFNAVNTLRAEPWGTASQTAGDYFALLILTGLRRTEGLSLRWDCVDFRERTLTALDTKNHKDHTLPLSDYLIDLLEARRKAHEADAALAGTPFVFPGSGRAGHFTEPRYQQQRIVKESGVAFRIHDLRRTFVTTAERLGVPTYALSALVNHDMGGHPITRDYVSIEIERLREPMQTITDYVLKAAGLRASATVMPIDGREAL